MRDAHLFSYVWPFMELKGKNKKWKKRQGEPRNKGEKHSPGETHGDEL